MNSHLDIHSTPTPNVSAHLNHRSGDQLHAHLSEDQIDDQLIGDLAPGPAAHLAACSICADRVAEAADPMASFRSVTLAWSERRAATLPIPTFSLQKPLWQRHIAWVTACFAFALGIALTNAGHQVATRTAELQPMQLQSTQQAASQAPVLTETASIAPSIATAPRAQQISSDNQMLKAIDDELDTSADSPSVLGLEPVSAHSGQPPTAISVQD